MVTNHAFRSLLLATGVLLLAACATPPEQASTPLDEKYFQREATNYQKFLHDGQIVYCQSEPNVGSLIPHKMCITEEALRQRVENFRRERNAVPPPLVQRG